MKKVCKLLIYCRSEESFNTFSLTRRIIQIEMIACNWINHDIPLIFTVHISEHNIIYG